MSGRRSSYTALLQYLTNLLAETPRGERLLKKTRDPGMVNRLHDFRFVVAAGKHDRRIGDPCAQFPGVGLAWAQRRVKVDGVPAEVGGEPVGQRLDQEHVWQSLAVGIPLPVVDEDLAAQWILPDD